MAEARSELDRRDVLRRAAYVGTALVWTAPVVQSLSGTAWASESGSVAVEGTKNKRDEEQGSGREVEGGGLARTGADYTAEIVVTGAGLVAAGATAMAVARHRQKPAPAGEAVAGDSIQDKGPKHRRPKGGQ